jgi:hypothetical protein
VNCSHNVLPLTSGARRQAGVSYSAVAAVFVQKSGQSATMSLEAMAQQFAAVFDLVEEAFAAKPNAAVPTGVLVAMRRKEDSLCSA